MAALPSGFRERLEQMEHTRNHHLSLLHAEKEIQVAKSQILSDKISNIRSADQRCLSLEHKIASQNLVISLLRSEIDDLDSKYGVNLQNFRILKSEVEELEKGEKEKERYFGLRTKEMEEFTEQVERFSVECRVRVEELKKQMEELKSNFDKLHGDIRHSDKLSAAERRKSELLAEKESLDKRLASNYQRREQLQKQLHSILMAQTREQRKLRHHTGQQRCLEQRT